MDDQSRLIQGQQLQRAGRHQESYDLLQPLALSKPENVQLQMSFGLSARAIGQFPDALRAFGRARATQPMDPQIANIEANTMAEAGDVVGALERFDILVRDHPAFVDGHINRAITAQSHDESQALHLVANSLNLHKTNARLWSIRGAILKNLNRLPEALEALDQAISLDPSRALSFFNRGIVYRALEQFQSAENDYLRAESLGLKGAQFDSAKAAVHLEMGRVDSSEVLYERAFFSGDFEAAVALARLKKEYREEEDTFAHYERALTASHGHPSVWQAYLSNLLDYGEFDLLRQRAEAAVHAYPDDHLIRISAAFGEAWAGDRRKGIAALDRLAKLDPSNHWLRVSLSELFLSIGDFEQGEQNALQATRIAPTDQGGWAFLATAWRAMGDEREFWLCDYDRFVLIEEVIVPSVADGAADYAGSIAPVLHELHSAKNAPGNQSLKSGTQTSGSLFGRTDPRLQQMGHAMLEAARRAIQRLPDDASHPFLVRKSQMIEFKGSWSVRLAGGGGHHVPHFHGEGWLSSAYYAQLPDVMNARQNGHNSDEGAIQFGAPPDKLGLDLPPRRIVHPEPGRLVLFPSYMWHGTLPYSGNDVRLTAAFDLIPSA